MSILIKGMDMPQDGCHHTITIYADGSIACGMRNNYSAIEIPKHGRLIDADALESAIDKYEMIHGRLKYDFTASAPTIVEEEEKGEER